VVAVGANLNPSSANGKNNKTKASMQAGNRFAINLSQQATKGTMNKNEHNWSPKTSWCHQVPRQMGHPKSNKNQTSNHY